MRRTCEKNVDPNATVVLTAVPDEDAYFVGWGGACAGTDLTCTITMQGNRSVTAEFVTDITAPVPSLQARRRVHRPGHRRRSTNRCEG